MQKQQSVRSPRPFLLFFYLIFTLCFLFFLPKLHPLPQAESPSPVEAASVEAAPVAEPASDPGAPEGRSVADPVDDPVDESLREAFLFLNRVRENPGAFSEIVGMDLSPIQARRGLKWNTHLAAAAEAKARDMAWRNYLDHITPEGHAPAWFGEQEGYIFPLSWPDIDRTNYNESISGGSSRDLKEHIINLLYDRGAPHESSRADHRRHLLGMNDFWALHEDVGIGFAYNPESTYRGYLVVMTGVPGRPFRILEGELILSQEFRRSLSPEGEGLWLGAIDSGDEKYWTRLPVAPKDEIAPFRLRVPAEETLILRYFLDRGEKGFLRGYYQRGGTVLTMAEAERITPASGAAGPYNFRVLPPRDHPGFTGSAGF